MANEIVQVQKPTNVVQSTQQVQGERKDKSWVTALILSILLGGLGIDRFYMGYIWQGILKLITAGGFGVWWLIDLILIATKHNFGKVNWI